MNYVNELFRQLKNDIKNIIDGILSRYDNIVYYHKYKKFYKGHYGVLELIKDKVNLAIACFSKSISNYNVSGTINGIPHSIWLENVVKGKLRRTERNRVK